MRTANGERVRVSRPGRIWRATHCPPGHTLTLAQGPDGLTPGRGSLPTHVWTEQELVRWVTAPALRP